MSILRLSTISLTLIIAVFALGHVNPASAGKVKNCDPGEGPVHPSCKPNPDDDPPTTATKFTVELTGGNITTDNCTGLNKGSKLSAEFPGVYVNNNRDGCAEFAMTDGMYPGVKLYLGEIAVTQQNTRVILFFNSDPTVKFPGNETGYQTNRLAATATSSGGVLIP